MNAFSPLSQAYPAGNRADFTDALRAGLKLRTPPVVRAAERVADFSCCPCSEAGSEPCARCRDLARIVMGAVFEAAPMETGLGENTDRLVEKAAISDVQDRAGILIDELALLGDEGAARFSPDLIGFLHQMASHSALRFAGTALYEMLTLGRMLSAICDGWRKSIPRDATRIAAAAAIDLDDAFKFLCGLYACDTAVDGLPCEVCA